MIDLRPWVDSSGLLGDDDGLRARFETDGALFFRGLVPPDDVRPLGDLVSRSLVDLGFCDAAGAPLRGTPDYADPDYVRLQQIAYPSPEMDRLRRHRNVLDVLHALLGPALGMGRGDIVRLRARGAVTRPHQDRHYLPGDDALVAAWHPLRPCPLEHGPVAVLTGSHRGGLRPHAGPRRSEFGIDPVPAGPWSAGPLELGDVVLFSDLTIHRGLPTRAEVLRVSVDFRYRSSDASP